MINFLRAIGALLCSSICVAQPIILDWDEVAWTPTNRVANYLIDGVSVDINVTDESNSLVNATPAIFSFYQGDQAAPVNALLFSSSLPTLGTDNEVVIEVDLGDLGIGVDDLSFKLFDVDGELDAFARQEQYVIAGALDGAEVLPAIITGNIDVHDINGHVVQGLLPTDPVGGNASQGVVQVAFDQPVDALTIRFSVAEGALINPGSTPGFGLFDMVFSEVAPDLAVTINNCELGVATQDSLIYTVSVDNVSLLDVDAAILTTTMPAEASNINWQCVTGPCLNASGTGDLNETINLQAGTSTTYLMSVDLSGGQIAAPFSAMSEVMIPAVQGETNLSNNVAFDNDVIGSFIFKNSFECHPPSA